MRKILDQHVAKPVRIPAKLLRQFDESETCAPYLVSCFQQPAVLYVSKRFENITGYPGLRFKNEGNQFWFSLIHPADIQGVVGSITKAHHDLEHVDPRPNYPLQLEYRIKRNDGKFVWIRELKFIVSYRQGKKDHVLGCIRDITDEKAAQQKNARKVLQREKRSQGLLDVALSYALDDKGRRQSRETGEGMQISNREQQVLELVAAGSSSKQIAAQLTISENTVETHRRNLLKKFKVNNSTALVKEAHRLALI